MASISIPCPAATIRPVWCVAYSQAAATLNLLRAFAGGGYANLRQVHQWTLDFMGRTPWTEKFAQMADRIGEALDFMEACGIDPGTVPQLQGTSFYTSHEALFVCLTNRRMTRRDSLTGDLVRDQPRTCCGSAIAPAFPPALPISNSRARDRQSARHEVRAEPRTGRH